MTTTRLSISGMSCAGCVASVETALNNVAGVVSATVNFAEHTATVKGDVRADNLVDAVVAAGYQAAELKGIGDEAEKEAAEMDYYRRLLKKAGVAAAVGFPLFIFFNNRICRFKSFIDVTPRIFKGLAALYITRIINFLKISIKIIPGSFLGSNLLICFSTACPFIFLLGESTHPSYFGRYFLPFLSQHLFYF